MINANQFNKEYNFEIFGASYIENPKNNTALYVTKKLEAMLKNLSDVVNCIVFFDKGMNIPVSFKKMHCFISSDNPAYAYSKLSADMYKQIQLRDSQREYTFTKGKYYLGENAIVGANVIIEPGVFIGHDVVIGDNSCIFSGAVIKHSTIGRNCIINENSVIGLLGYTMAKDEYGNNTRIYSLGNVSIGNDVEIGASTTVCLGTGGDTVIGDYSKIDGQVHIGHDFTGGSNISIIAGSIIGGFCSVNYNSYIGLGAVLRNRVSIGKNTLVGMGSVVTKSFGENLVIMGNPARIKE